MKKTNLKKTLFYPILSFGHLNVCISIGQRLLSFYEDIEVYFLVDEKWKEKLYKIEPKFKFVCYELPEFFKDKDIVQVMVEKFKPILNLDLIQQTDYAWSFVKDQHVFMKAIDENAFLIINQIKPDLILMDQFFLPLSVYKSKIPYVFIMSAVPWTLDKHQRNFLGCDAFEHEKEKIEKFRKVAASRFKEIEDIYINLFKQEGIDLEPDLKIFSQLSKYFTIYCYPDELDIFDKEYIKENNLIQIDSPVSSNRLSKPYELPKEFLEKPGKIIYISLGSIYSAYTFIMQKLIDDLACLPHKFIISKGINGDKLKLPANFYGENFLDQIAVLQISDLIISHGGNNTLTECFYFGVPMVILPCMLDQFNNMARIVEKGFGVKRLYIFTYTKKELYEIINKMLTDEQLISKWKLASQRIQKDAKLDACAKYIHKFMIENPI